MKFKINRVQVQPRWLGTKFTPWKDAADETIFEIVDYDLKTRRYKRSRGNGDKTPYANVSYSDNQLDRLFSTGAWTIIKD